jgi:hypothetical protein
MRKVLVGIILSTIVCTSALWAGGGKQRHGQDGTQPRTRTQRSTGEPGLWGQCTGTNACVRSGQTGDETGTKQRTRKQIRKELRKQNGSCQSAKKQIRDRKRDGSCQLAAAQKRTRTRQQSRDGSC